FRPSDFLSISSGETRFANTHHSCCQAGARKSSSVRASAGQRLRGIVGCSALLERHIRRAGSIYGGYVVVESCEQAKSHRAGFTVRSLRAWRRGLPKLRPGPFVAGG